MASDLVELREADLDDVAAGKFSSINVSPSIVVNVQTNVAAVTGNAIAIGLGVPAIASGGSVGQLNFGFL